MSRETENPETQYTAKLELSGRAKRIFREAFREGMFKPDIQAITEFVHNDAGARDRNTGQTRVVLSIAPDKFSSRSVKGDGMDPESIQKFFRMGETTDRGSSHAGMGAKIAAMALAADFEMEVKPPNSQTKWKVDAPGLGDEKIDYSGQLRIVPRPVSQYEEPDGSVHITLTDMKWGHPPSAAELRDAIAVSLGEILIDEDVEWGKPFPPSATTRQALNVVPQTGIASIGNIRDKMAVYVSANRKVVQVKPPTVPLEPNSAISKTIVHTSQGEPLLYEGGIIDFRSPQAKKIKPGGQIIFDGVTLEQGVFPDDERARDSRVRRGLHFKVQIDGMGKRTIEPDLQMNKSAGLRPGGARDRIIEAVTEASIPIMESIIVKESTNSTPSNANFRERLIQGRRVADAAISQLIAEGEIDPHGMLAIATQVTKGQKHPTHTEENTGQDTEPTGVAGTPWNKQKPRTLAPQGADPNIGRRRASPYNIRYGPVPSGETSIVSVEGKRKYLTINSGHPLNAMAELMATLEPTAGGLLATAVAAREQILHLSTELSEGDQEKQQRIFQAGLAAVGKILAQDPAWSHIEESAKQTLSSKPKKSRKK